MAHAHTPPKSEQKPYFTDYTVAGTDEGRVNAAVLKALYWQKQDCIRVKRLLRLDKLKPYPVKTRGGFPTKREIDYSLPSKRGMSKALSRFKVTVSAVATQPPYVRTKILQLHATRGWKAFA